MLGFGIARGRRRMTRVSLRGAMLGTASTAAMMHLLIVGASLLGYLCAATQAPQADCRGGRRVRLPVWVAMVLLMAPKG